MQKILIIEDDMDIAELERDYLEANGFSVEIVGDGSLGEKRALEADVDLILLDIMLPGMDGFQVCRKVREARNIPILLVSARQEDVDKIRGLGLECPLAAEVADALNKQGHKLPPIITHKELCEALCPSK